ncbi:MAG: ornithine carbamoyltransferase [Ignavibacteriales bacterium]|nr:ornithine carbamoyltransferase [Ignavibacteriales bacterium]
MKKDFLSLHDITPNEVDELFALTDSMKKNPRYRPLEGKSVAMIFQKPSLRTRVSFEVGIVQLGGHPVFLSQEGIGIGVREKASDIAHLLSRMTSMIVARLYEHSLLEELAQTASIPVINALTDLSHPCQIVSDMYTLRQHNKLKPGVKVVFVGDGNNVVNSWLEMAMLYPMHFVLAAPKGYHPDPTILKNAQASKLSQVEIIEDPMIAVKNADVIYTDVWTSMGQEAEAELRRKAFTRYVVDAKLLSSAKTGCVVMHCLPAHRGEEITGDVLEGKQSIVFDQAENRLHAQKAIMAKLIESISRQID